jgi:hypothetical protein
MDGTDVATMHTLRCQNPKGKVQSGVWEQFFRPSRTTTQQSHGKFRKTEKLIRFPFYNL